MGRYLYPTRFRLIEEEVEYVINEYGLRFNPITNPPVPVEMIAEKLFGLACEMESLIEFGDDLIGVLIPKEKRIVVEEECTDPQYHFTVAHEIAHWHLHVDIGTEDLFVDKPATFAIMLRSKTSELRDLDIILETEANRFAAALLIPRKLLKRVVEEINIIESQTIVSLSELFNTSISTMLFRVYHLEKYGELLTNKIHWESLEELEIEIKSMFQ